VVRGRLGEYLRRFRESQAILQLNLFLALPELRGTRRLSRLARRVALRRLYNDLDFATLRWNPFEVMGLQHLESSLERGRGAIVCTQHLGPYRRIFHELLRRGHAVHLLVDAKVARSFKPQAATQLRRQGWSMERIEQHLGELEILNAEQPGSVQQMLRALRANEMVLVYLDGNTGVSAPGEGTRRHANNVTVGFFGHPITVRRGVCQIAHATGASLVPLFARWEAGHRPMMRFLEPVRPEPDEARDTFARRGMRRLFQLSERAIRRDPEQYEEWVHVHRWRSTERGSEKESARDDEDLAAARRELREVPDRRLRVDPGRAAVLQVGSREVLVDGVEGRILPADPLTVRLARRCQRTVRLEELLRSFRADEREDALDHLARLHALGVLEEVQTQQHARASTNETDRPTEAQMTTHDATVTPPKRPSKVAPTDPATAAGRTASLGGDPSRVEPALRFLPRLAIRALARPGKRAFVRSLLNTYHGNVLNLSLALPERFSRRDIRKIARGAVLTYLRNEAEYLAPRRWGRLPEGSSEMLADALERGKGAVVACQHLGPQRYALLEVARRSSKVHAAVTEKFVSRLRSWLDRLARDAGDREEAELASRVEILTVEEPTCALKMVRALKRGEVVFFDVDGNIGVGGEKRTRQGTLTLSFLGRDIHVRKGVAYLSHRTGAPIVPVTTLWEEQGPRVRFQPPLSPEEKEGKEEYTERALTHLYGQLENHLLRHPEQWEMWPHFFKWITPPEPLSLDEESLASLQDDLRAALREGSETRLHADPQRVFVLRVRDKRLLIDREGFRFFLTSRGGELLLERLHRGTTLGRLVRELRSSLSVDDILRELARFQVLGVWRRLEESPS